MAFGPARWFADNLIMVDSVMIENEETDCPYCGEIVVSHWLPGQGCLSSPDYVLVADWIYHAACWDKQVADHPP